MGAGCCSGPRGRDGGWERNSPHPRQLRPPQRGCPPEPQFLRSPGNSGGTPGLPQSPPRTSRQVWRDTPVVCTPQEPGKPLLPARRCLGCIPCAGESVCHLHYLQGPMERVRTAWAAPCFSGTPPSAPAPVRPSLKTTLQRQPEARAQSSACRRSASLCKHKH